MGAIRAKLEFEDVTLNVVHHVRMYTNRARSLVAAFDYTADWDVLAEISKTLQKEYDSIPVDETVWPVLNGDAMLAREILRKAMLYCTEQINALTMGNHEIVNFWVKGVEDRNWLRMETLEQVADHCKTSVSAVRGSLSIGNVNGIRVISRELRKAMKAK